MHAVDGAASLSISGTGSLATEGTGGISFSGIVVQGNGGKAELTINNVDVTATNTSDYAQGILLQSADSSPATLTVNGGELTASGQRAGIKYVFGSSGTGGGTPTVTVSNNAIVRTNGGISDDSSTDIQIGADSNESNGGIVFDSKNGTVYGDVTLQEDITIGEGESLTIPDGSSLNMGGHEITVASGGKLEGQPTGNGTLKIAPTITTESMANGEVGTAYSQKLEATGDPTITWSVTSGTLPAGLRLSEDGKITGTPTTAGTSTFTVTATNSAGSDSKGYTLTIKSVPVTGVTLDKTNLSLTVGGTETLTATVHPDNATNKNVTWSSSNNSVATVDSTGTVTAVSAGTATITATAADGSGHSATCAVTVTQPDRDPTYSVTLPGKVEGGTVTANKRYAEKGETFPFTVTPDEGWELDTLTVTDRSGKKLEVTHKGGGVYTFQMPAGQVEIQVSFRESIPEPLPFTDVGDGTWYSEAVRYAYEHGLMAGTSATAFSPNATTSRSMIATILWRLEGSPQVDYAMAFDDVAANSWYAEAIRWAASEGIVGGYGNGLFGTNDPITREQFAAMLYRFAQEQGYDVSIGENTNILSYTDVADLSEYAISAMQWAVGAGIINGTGDGSTLSPQGQATRAQVAVILTRYCENVAKQ